MKILYLGLPLGALMLLREGHDLVGACISRPSMPGMRRLRRLMAERKAPLLGKPDLTSSLVQGLLATTDPELVVSWFWTRRIPSTVLALAARGGVNVHPSLLPRHRGPDPYFWTLALGDAETGVTAHWISADYDQGEVLAQRRMPVPEGVNAWQLARSLDRPSLEALRDVVRAIERGEARGVAQDETSATQAPRPPTTTASSRGTSPPTSSRDASAPRRPTLARSRASTTRPWWCSPRARSTARCGGSRRATPCSSTTASRWRAPTRRASSSSTRCARRAASGSERARRRDALSRHRVAGGLIGCEGSVRRRRVRSSKRVRTARGTATRVSERCPRRPRCSTRRRRAPTRPPS